MRFMFPKNIQQDQYRVTGGILMLIDIHAHAAGDYSKVDSIKNMAAKYDLEKIVLCTSPKNIQKLKEPDGL